ncbi:GreA/GreB family elongation factor [Microvirga sp. STR05]|uniref:GreA/GreB family elongation factor n=1 Tax=Hymenobacter duratus TaxID=2771356 RepID=A0ABR8JMC4_9BACT|nr:GreA/GreB family elongation factor [Hymenobacter duratus]MBD2715934.1 GreA/GreB family elongation factor [Hymenobacter duratus]MBR7950848.1 GreA/GreB family elongation factor [Microvirga sp. STR05]
MSRAFTKEDDSLEAPIVPPRAPLPASTPNYVTPQGLEQLRTELTDLEASRARAESNRENEADRTRQLTIHNARISALNARIASARLVDPRTQPPREVRFGATVMLRTRSGGISGAERRFTIVGVDEASVADGKIAFTAPIARLLQGCQLGQIVSLRLGPKEEMVEIAEIRYEGG